ncbi:MAG: ceramidase domain-containing protein [Planctomycetes bacterium]|nr:ceramidase domain-containing protein [Planctomycetota bacterium]
MSRLIPEPRRRRLVSIGLLLLALLAALGLILAGPIAQDPAYHHFADRRTRLGIPQFWNVVSNLPFLVVGVLGWARLRRREGPSLPTWRAFFVAVALVAFGSAWYHLEPNDRTLVWDRLPMAAGFMALFSAFLGEKLDGRYLRLLWPMMALGVASVLDWAWRGDLRVYAFVQFFPLLGLLLMLVALPAMRAEWRLVGLALLAYLLAKLLEAGDGQVESYTGGLLSGHPLKHLAAAAGPYFLMLRFPRRLA